MKDYVNGIVRANGCIVTDSGKKYLIVRNFDKWYPMCVSEETGYKVYHTFKNEKDQWAVKARSLNTIPVFEDILSEKDFCRSVIEIRGVLDLAKAKSRKGDLMRRLRLRIYGDFDLMQYINHVLPAGGKKIQDVVTNSGKTCALYYQSKNEILNILGWIDGYPRNEKIWSDWSNTLALLKR